MSFESNKIKGTKTEQNLIKAFIGESHAYMKYSYFSKIAKKDGLEQIADVFIKTAYNENAHAKTFFSFLKGGKIEVKNIIFNADMFDTTIENLKLASIGERMEYSKIYPEMANIAINEGFFKISELYKNISKIEKYHENRYLELFDNLENNRFFRKGLITKWQCRNCGYVYENKEALSICPVCSHSMAYMEELSENF
ncbi:MAG: rubrerythrin family protein [Endomicrobium sp.]|jgi:rubrerythrin|nr:rubrerythrin family protein [Endomicrobium sp.]